MTHEVKGILLDAGQGLAIGGGYSYGMAQVMPELIHGGIVFATGLGTALGVFFLNRLLRKKFPEGK